jgi:uncharacterized phage protein (TIGR02218 family)
MKTASAGLIAHLTEGHAFRRADLWTFTLAGGTVARYTTLDADVKVGADTWLANGPVLTRPRSRLAAGTEVDEFEVTVESKATDTIGGLPWPQAARRGVLRHGRLLIERVYMPSFVDVSLGKLYMMGGRMAEIHGDGAQVRIGVRSDLELLNTKIPVDVVQPSCRHTLFDAGCTLSAAAFKVPGVVVAAGSTVGTLLASLAQESGWFSLGRVVFTSGPNNGASRQVRQHTLGSPASLKLAVPLFASPVAGDTFDLYPGCDRTMATCASSKFNNLDNFGGEPFVPRPETAA